MKSSQYFIIEKLNFLFDSFDDIKIRYEYRDFLSIHIIEILPLNVFEENKDFILLEIDIQDQFEEEFGDKEELLFISSNSLNQINDPIFELGYGFFENNTVKIDEHITSFSYSSIEYSIDEVSYALAA